MHNFADTTGRAWNLDLNVAVIQRVRERAKVDLLGIGDKTLVTRLEEDAVLLCEVLFACIGPDAGKLSLAEFAALMKGPQIDAAFTALIEELVDFLPNANRRLWAAMLTARDKQVTNSTEVTPSGEYCWEIAGECGVDPGPFTLRQLALLARGRRKLLWGQTSAILCLLANRWRDSRGQPDPFRPDDFNPTAPQRQAPAPLEVPITALKSFLG